MAVHRCKCERLGLIARWMAGAVLDTVYMCYRKPIARQIALKLYTCSPTTGTPSLDQKKAVRCRSFGAAHTALVQMAVGSILAVYFPIGASECVVHIAAHCNFASSRITCLSWPDQVNKRWHASDLYQVADTLPEGDKQPSNFQFKAEALSVERDRKVVVTTEAVKGGKQDRVRGTGTLCQRKHDRDSMCISSVSLQMLLL